MVYTTSSARSAPNPPPHSHHHSARPPLFSQTPQNTTSNTSQGSTHTRSRRTMLLARGRSHHMLATGSGGTKLGRKDAGELLCLVKIRHSLKRLETTKGRTRRRCWMLMLQCAAKQRFCLVSFRGETCLRSRRSILFVSPRLSSCCLEQNRKTTSPSRSPMLSQSLVASWPNASRTHTAAHRCLSPRLPPPAFYIKAQVK
jgi:hypothetical protein